MTTTRPIPETTRARPASPTDASSSDGAWLHAHDHDGRSAEGARVPTPSAGWTGTVVRIIFGVIWAIDAYLKWLPGYRHSYIDQLRTAAQGQPSWLHGWFHFWITLQSGAPTLFATLTGLTETLLAIVLLFGVARRVGYTLGAAYMLVVWAVGEGFGGPYVAGSTDVGTGIVYSLLFVTLLAFAPPARRERLSLDRFLERRWAWWRHVAEPHAVDRVHGAPLVEPVVIGSVRPPRERADRNRAAAGRRDLGGLQGLFGR